MTQNGNNNELIFADLAGRTARLMLYGLLAIALMAMDHRGRYVDGLHRWAANAVQPIYRLVHLPAELAARAGDYFGSRQDLRRRVDALENERLIREAELLHLTDLAAENEELRRIILARARVQADYLPAEFLRVHLNPFSHRVIINRGRRDGVREGMPVIDAGGVVGQVDQVYRATASVILISDPDHALPVSVYRTGQRTIAYGTGDAKTLKLSDMPVTADLVPGDLILTSGLDERFPPGLPVGEIQRISRSPGDGFLSVRAHPLGQLDRGRHVLLIMHAPDRHDDDPSPGPAP